MATNGSALALERGLPTNVEAEQFVLGSILLDDSVFPLVAGTLDAADFSIEKHRRIFLRMRELQERGENIEYLTLVEEIDKHNQLEACDGIAYISSLTDGLPRLSSIESYLKIVRDKSLLRNLIFTAQNIITQCIEGGQEAEDLVADAESAVMKIGDANLRSGLADPAQIVDDFAGGREAFLDPAQRLRGLSTPFFEIRRVDDRPASVRADHHSGAPVDGQDRHGVEYRPTRSHRFAGKSGTTGRCLFSRNVERGSADQDALRHRPRRQPPIPRRLLE